MENEFTTQDMISLSYDQKPIEFQQAFDHIMSSKIAAAIDTKKMEIAGSIYGQPEEESEEISDQEEETDGETA